MKKLLLAVPALLLCCANVRAQNVEGQIIAVQYGEFKVPSTSSGGFLFAPASCQVTGGGKNFAAFAAGVPVKVVDSSPSLTEVDTPSSVYIDVCTLNMATAYSHNPPFYLTSGTGGLQEAIDANQTNDGPNTILLNPEWYKLVVPSNPATVIASVKGIADLGLEDITTTPATWYRWNGSQYIVIGSAGASIPASNLVLKGSGSAGIAEAAVPGTDYLEPSLSTLQTLSGALQGPNFNATDGLFACNGSAADCAEFVTNGSSPVTLTAPATTGTLALTSQLLTYPGAGVVASTGSAWGTSYATQGTDSRLLTSGTISGTAASLCTDSGGGATTLGCPTGIPYPSSGITTSTGAAWGAPYSAQGTDSKLLTSGAISGTGNPLCTDSGGGATTLGCPAGIPYPSAGITVSTGSAWTTPYSVQGTDTALLTSGSISGTASTLCTDANGGATTAGCSSGGSGSPMYMILPNDSSGTGLGLLAEWAQNTLYQTTVKTVPTTNNMGTNNFPPIVGVCISGCGTSGNGTFQFGGAVQWTCDDSATAGEWVQPSSTAAGECDAISITISPNENPDTNTTLGRVIAANTGTGTAATVQLLPFAGYNNQPAANPWGQIITSLGPGSPFMTSTFWGQDSSHALSSGSPIHLYDCSTCYTTINGGESGLGASTTDTVIDTLTNAKFGAGMLRINGSLYSVEEVGTESGTISVNLSQTTGVIQWTLTGNATLVPTGDNAGHVSTFEIIQAASGGPYSFTWPSNFLNAPGISQVASGVTLTQFFYDGTNYICVSGCASVTPSTGSFTWANQGSSTATQSTPNGPILLSLAYNSALNWRFLYEAQPSTPYKIISRMQMISPNTGGGNQATGLYFSDGTKYEGIETYVNATGIITYLRQLTDVNCSVSCNTTSLVTQAGNQTVGDYLTPIWYQIRNTGTSLYFDVSFDGKNFLNLGTDTVGAFITPTKVGFGGLSNYSSSSFTDLDVFDWEVVPNANLDN